MELQVEYSDIVHQQLDLGKQFNYILRHKIIYEKYDLECDLSSSTLTHKMSKGLMYTIVF